jgi:translocator protein
MGEVDSHPSAPSGARLWVGLVVWVGLAFSASLAGAAFSPGNWYADLDKPAFNPPGWVFGPVWTLLYVMMGTSAWLVWRKAGFRAARIALGLYLIQLALNAAWTPVFFGAQRPDLAFIVIVALWLAVAATIAAFKRHSLAAMLLLVPYIAWVSFAAVLNFTLWQLN